MIASSKPRLRPWPRAAARVLVLLWSGVARWVIRGQAQLLCPAQLPRQAPRGTGWRRAGERSLRQRRECSSASGASGARRQPRRPRARLRARHTPQRLQRPRQPQRRAPRPCPRRALGPSGRVKSRHSTASSLMGRGCNQHHRTCHGARHDDPHSSGESTHALQREPHGLSTTGSGVTVSPSFPPNKIP